MVSSSQGKRTRTECPHTSPSSVTLQDKIVNKLTAENITITAIIKLVMILLAVLGKNLLWIAVLVTAIADLITILQAKRIR